MAQSTSRNDSAGGLPGAPREGVGAPLSGRAVLLPRLKERDRIASALERAGARVLRAAVTRTVPGEAAALEATARRIAAGEAAWLVLTSARTVEALAPYLLAEAALATRDQALHQEPGTSGPPQRLRVAPHPDHPTGTAPTTLKHPADAGGRRRPGDGTCVDRAHRDRPRPGGPRIGRRPPEGTRARRKPSNRRPRALPGTRHSQHPPRHPVTPRPSTDPGIEDGPSRPSRGCHRPA